MSTTEGSCTNRTNSSKIQLIDYKAAITYMRYVIYVMRHQKCVRKRNAWYLFITCVRYDNEWPQCLHCKY